MNYPQPTCKELVRVRGVKDAEGKSLYIRSTRVMKHALVNTLRGDGASTGSRMDLEAARPVATRG